MPPMSAWCAREATKNDGLPLAAGEHRAHDGDVRQVRAAGVGRVQHPGAAAAEFARVRGDDGAHARAHGAEVNGHVRRVRDERAAGVEQRAGEIEPLADVDRDGRRLQHGAHLLRHLHEAVVEELELRRDRRVRASIGRGLPRLVPREPERAVGQALGRPAGLDDRRRIRLDDERGSRDRLAAARARRARRAAPRASRRTRRRRDGSRRRCACARRATCDRRARPRRRPRRAASRPAADPPAARSRSAA